MPGAVPAGAGLSRFRVWAPRARLVEVRLMSRGRLVPLEERAEGWHAGSAEASPGDRYVYRLDGGIERPDPASRSQPEGVHGPSAVADPDFPWTDERWPGRPLSELAFYEIHVGTFTPEGTFDAVLPRLPDLVRLGVTAVELMPVAAFPGDRNWGYDGVFPFAVHAGYGGPAGLKRLVDACHAHGLAAFLDVVHNHVGPEGSVLADFGPYFTDRYPGHWGPALNFDGPGSDEVRAYFLANALMWIREFHFDGLRLDAVHAIFDASASPFLEELAARVHREAEVLGRCVHVVAESDANDARLVRPPGRGGVGMDALWSDDYHHALHALLTGERHGYYADFGGIGELGAAMRDGFALAGRFSAYRGRRHGRPAADLPGDCFVVYAQNHDQVGNRMLGERLSTLVDLERLKLAAGVAVLAPFLPLLFMGEEYGETAPFLYFISHGDPALARAAREGRRRDFAGFGWLGEAPDPQDPETFGRSRLDWSRRSSEPHRTIEALHRELFRLRRSVPALTAFDPSSKRVWTDAGSGVLALRRERPGTGSAALLLCHFGGGAAVFPCPHPQERWIRVLDSAEPLWRGPGSPAPERLDPGPPNVKCSLAPWAFALYVGKGEN
jgi:maltooligosyltrehalose trehalohydrolase